MREGDPRYVGASEFSEIKAQAAPTGTNVEDTLVGLESKLGRKVTFLGELCVVERCIRRLEICAAVLPVCVEEERIQPAVQVVMVRDIALSPLARIKLGQSAPDVAQKPLRPPPTGHLAFLAEQEGEYVGDCALLNHQRAIHIRFAKFEFGIEQYSELSRARRQTHRNGHASAIAKCKSLSPRGGEIERTPPDECTEQSLKQPVHRPPPSPNPRAAIGPFSERQRDGCTNVLRYLIKVAARQQCCKTQCHHPSERRSQL